MRTSAERGQSLIEVIVASGIIMSAVASSLTLMTSGLRAEKTSEAQITAGNLAREGVEVVRGMRDSNWLAGVAFDTGMVGTGNDYVGTPVFNPTANTWSLDFTESVITGPRAIVYRYTTGPVGSNAAVGLMVQPSTAAAPASTAATIYRRLITVDPLCLNGTTYTVITTGTCSTTKIGVRVTSTVRWTVANAVKTMSIEERLLDWR